VSSGISSRSLRYSRPRVLPPDGVGVPQTFPRHRLGRIGRPWFVPSPLGHRQSIGSPSCTTATATNARRGVTVRWSAGDDATTMRGPPAATIRTEVATMTVGRTVVLLLNDLALESLAGPSAALSFWPSFANRPTSRNTAVKPTPSFGWPITAWLVS
jgi:hypothetical protein